MEVWHICKFIKWLTAALHLTLSLALTIAVKVLRKVTVCLDTIFLIRSIFGVGVMIRFTSVTCQASGTASGVIL